MKIILFDQWDKLVAMFKSIAGKAATEKSQLRVCAFSISYRAWRKVKPCQLGMLG